MWGNISKHVGAAIQQVQKLQSELESQLDAAVGVDDGVKPPPPTKILFDITHLNEIPPKEKEISTTKGADDVTKDSVKLSVGLSNALHVDSTVASDEKVKNTAEGNGFPNNSISSNKDITGDVLSLAPALKDDGLACLQQSPDSGWDFDDSVFETKELKSASTTDLHSEEVVTEGQIGDDAQEDNRGTDIFHGAVLDKPKDSHCNSSGIPAKEITPHSEPWKVTNGVMKPNVPSATKGKRKKSAGASSKSKIESADANGSSLPAAAAPATATADSVSTAPAPPTALLSPLALTSTLMPTRPLNFLSEGLKGLLHSANREEGTVSSTSCNMPHDNDDDAVTTTTCPTATIALSATAQQHNGGDADADADTDADADAVTSTTQQHDVGDVDADADADAVTTTITTQQHDDADAGADADADAVTTTTQQHDIADADADADAVTITITTQQHDVADAGAGADADAVTTTITTQQHDVADAGAGADADAVTTTITTQQHDDADADADADAGADADADAVTTTTQQLDVADADADAVTTTTQQHDVADGGAGAGAGAGADADAVTTTISLHDVDDADADAVTTTTQQHGVGDADAEAVAGADADADAVTTTTQQHDGGDGSADNDADADAVTTTTQKRDGAVGDNGREEVTGSSGHNIKDIKQKHAVPDNITNAATAIHSDADESTLVMQTASLIGVCDVVQSSSTGVEESHLSSLALHRVDTQNVNGVSFKEHLVDMERKHSLELETLRSSYEERIEQMMKESEASSTASKTLADTDILEQTVKFTSENAALSALVSELEGSLLEAKRELRRTLTAVSEKDDRFAKATEETSKLSELVTQRERALEASAVKMAETHMQFEAAQRKIHDLSAEVSEKDAKLRQSQVSATGEGELKKQLQRAQEVMKEKEGRLAAFELEGQNLSKKQSEMEKVVRSTKAEVKKRDTEIAKLKESKEQLVKAIEEMQDLVRKNELEASNAIKSLSAMQAVSQASTDKLSRLEGDVASKGEELASQRRAMEAAWAESNETKRLVAELRADRDDLRRQIGLGTSKVMETESSRRDIEQREAVLRATNKQLQDSLQRQMQESGLREERLRDEVGEMRKRWQDAVTSRETLSSELGSATAPLMRQIASMQDTVRTKSEAWQVIEASLSERALRAESIAELAEQKRITAEETGNEQKMKINTLSSRLEESILACQAAESALEKVTTLEASASARVAELESQLALEQGRMQSLQSSLRELELRHVIDQQDAKDAVDFISKQGEGILSRAVAESEALREELQAERGNVGKKKRISSQQNLSQERLSAPSSSNSLSPYDHVTSPEGSDGTNAVHDGDESSKSYSNRGYSTSTSAMQDTTLPSKFLLLV